jgi:hypothetical protein
VKQVKISTAIACEYIAQGSTNKHTLVNVYGGDDILVPQFPALIPLAFFLEIIPDHDTPKMLEIQILANRKVLHKFAGILTRDEAAARRGLLIIPQMPWMLERETEIKLVLAGEGIKTTTAISKKIRVGPIPA